VQELSLGLAAVAPQPGTKGREEKASTHFPKPADPEGGQMFLVCPFCFTPVGSSARGDVSVHGGEMYRELCVRNQRGWV